MDKICRVRVRDCAWSAVVVGAVVALLVTCVVVNRSLPRRHGWDGVVGWDAAGDDGAGLG